ncbi:MAG: hypothetical protein Q8R79_00730 [Legionellaceae bacterium]|nr:hypothetical protein [Legionellaceae bacterium]
MNHWKKTPQILSILTRKLKPGKTFEDFQQAHLPPGKTQKTEFGYQVDYFNTPTRVINAVSVTDPTLIVSIGLSYGDPQLILDDVKSHLPVEAERAKKIAEVADKVGPSMVYFVASDNSYGVADLEYHQLPFVKVTQELVDALQAMVPQK